MPIFKNVNECSYFTQIFPWHNPHWGLVTWIVSLFPSIWKGLKSPNQCLWVMQYKKQRDETYNGLMMMKPPSWKAVCSLGNTTERNKHSNFRGGQNKPLLVTVDVSVTLFLCLVMWKEVLYACSPTLVTLSSVRPIPVATWNPTSPLFQEKDVLASEPVLLGTWRTGSAACVDKRNGSTPSLSTCVIFPLTLCSLLCCFFHSRFWAKEPET